MIDFVLATAHHVTMGSVDPRALRATQTKSESAIFHKDRIDADKAVRAPFRACEPRTARTPLFLLAAGLLITCLYKPASQAADFHTNAVFNVTFSLPGFAQNVLSIPNVPLFTLSNLWTIAASNQPGALITTDGANQRTIAYNAFSNHLYLVSRTGSTESNYLIYALNASTGSVVSMLSTEGIYNGGAVGEGGIGLASIGVADDGAIYACNMTVDACGCGPGAGNPADSLFRIYRWADGNSNTAPVEIFSGDPAGQGKALRWGDALAVRGAGTNTQVLVDTADGTYAALLTPSDASLTNFVSTFFTNKMPITATGRSLQFAGTNSFLQKGAGTGLRLVKWDLTKHLFSIAATSSHFPNTAGQLMTNGLAVAAVLDFKGSATIPDGVKIYALQSFGAPALVDQADFPANHQNNPEFAGQVVMTGNFFTNQLWALDANNGLMALQVNGPRFIRYYTAVPAQLGNKEIIQALTRAKSLTNMNDAKLMLKTTGVGSDTFQSSFILRKGRTDVSVSGYLDFAGEVAFVSNESQGNGGTTNAIDYTIPIFTLTGPVMQFDVRGFGMLKSSSVVDRQNVIMARPLLSSLTTALDGVAIVQGESVVLHGNVAITGRKIEIVSNQPPVVSLSSPTNSQTFTASTNITLQARATDSDGSVSRVEFFQDGNKLGETTSHSVLDIFSFAWTNPPAGTFNLFAKATDNDGATSLSNTNTITVNP